MNVPWVPAFAVRVKVCTFWVKPMLVDLWTMKPVSVAALSVNVKRTVVRPNCVTARLVGAAEAGVRAFTVFDHAELPPALKANTL